MTPCSAAQVPLVQDGEHAAASVPGVRNRKPGGIGIHKSSHRIPPLNVPLAAQFITA